LMAWIFFIASKNPADSGESAIILVFFSYPWVSLIPARWMGPAAWAGCVMINALILYGVFGGVRRQHSG